MTSNPYICYFCKDEINNFDRVCPKKTENKMKTKEKRKSIRKRIKNIIEKKKNE